ncbi:hypothetical protein TNCV_2845751 [Trichonephila clavipes]|nr:hypothetical protein TNCV_2845751 [Trichonephila clavipes]
MAAVDFLHHENPPTWAGIEPATLGADGQQQTNYATQSALAELFCGAGSAGINYEGHRSFESQFSVEDT